MYLFDLPDDAHCQRVKRYLHLTTDVMPQIARKMGWPVVNDHCFQRIVLDTICGGTWYEHIRKPAYKHLTPGQSDAAVDLCERIIHGSEDLHTLNAQSLRWRGKQPRPLP